MLDSSRESARPPPEGAYSLQDALQAGRASAVEGREVASAPSAVFDRLAELGECQLVDDCGTREPFGMSAVDWFQLGARWRFE